MVGADLTVSISFLLLNRNDILRKHGIIPEKPLDPEPIIQESLLEAQQRAHENRLEDKTLDELHELEDDEDEAFLQRYRQKRLAELSKLQESSIHGQVYPIQKAEYARDVTEASFKYFVLVHLASSLGTNLESKLLSEIWRELAARFCDIKFCEIQADLCIENYPERNTPTILVYKNGDIQRQIITLRQFRGNRTNLNDLQTFLLDVGAVDPNDPRLKNQNCSETESGLMAAPTGEDEDEWD